jgi:hypothetical protein
VECFGKNPDWYLYHITENEIIDVIQILDPNKATGPDKISNKMLKISPTRICPNRHKRYHQYFDH